MKLTLAILALTFIAFVSGCSPAVSIRPLYTDADIKKPIVEPRIEGEWISPDLDKAGTDEELWLRWKIAPPSKPGESYSTYSVEFRPAKPDPQEGEEVISYNVRLVQIADKMFFDAEFEEQKHGQHKLGRGDIAGLAPAHLIGRVWVQQDFLRVALFNSEWVKDNSPESFQESVDAPDTNISVITGSASDLRKFVLQNADNEKALSYVLYLCRPGTDCAARAFEDALPKLPKDEELRDELLKEAASFFLIRGNFDRAIELLRRRLELKPHDISIRAALCRAILFKKDFAAARIEFAAAQKSALEESPSAAPGVWKDVLQAAYAEAAEGVVWSYFLEGDYAGTVTAAASYKPSEKHVSVNPILLSYFSLVRLGRRAAAESLLKEETVKFTGPREDHILLLLAQGRVTESGFTPSQHPENDEVRRSLLVSGLEAIARGNFQWAKSNLEQALSKAPNDSLIALAAKIELERLGPKSKK
jgi:Flp pilus assembly protein TadD